MKCLNLKSGDVVVDATVGSGGHAREILKAIGPKGRLVALDQDPEAIKRCYQIFDDVPQISLHYENFRNIDRVLYFLNIHTVNAVILDVGFSSDQLEDPGRGFSFERLGPLDMRMDPRRNLKARDLVNDLSKGDLEKLFRRYGEERWAKRFAEAICQTRKDKPIETTLELSHVIEEALPHHQRFRAGNRPTRFRRHPATRVFQALRIAVNDELDVLEYALPRIWKRLEPEGRVVTITFHSLEDRIVKQQFRTWCRLRRARPITKKPIVPNREEIAVNRRARTAKLRAVEKIA